MNGVRLYIESDPAGLPQAFAAPRPEGPAFASPAQRAALQRLQAALNAAVGRRRSRALHKLVLPALGLREMPRDRGCRIRVGVRNQADNTLIVRVVELRLAEAAHTEGLKDAELNVI